MREAGLRRLRFVRHSYIHKDEMVSKTILWQPAIETAKRRRSAITDTYCMKENIPLKKEYEKMAMVDRGSR